MGLLQYRSRLLGQDPRLTNTGGGNTSMKNNERDPLTRQPVDVLWIKASGEDLATATPASFCALYQEKLIALRRIHASYKDRGPKSQAEADLLQLYRHCAFNLHTLTPSIDTPLHSFMPARHVDHLHPTPILALANCPSAAALTHEVYGEDVVHVPWVRPGFELGIELLKAHREHPKASGILLGQHGLISWGDNSKDCYLNTLDLVERAARFAETRLQSRKDATAAFGGPVHSSLPDSVRNAILRQLLPWLRGRIDPGNAPVACVRHDERVLAFVNSIEAPRLSALGTACPDHVLRTRPTPLYIDLAADLADFSAAGIETFLAGLKQRIGTELARYRDAYTAYYRQFAGPASLPMRCPDPTVLLLPGIGLIAFGRNSREAALAAEFYTQTIDAMLGAECVERFQPLPPAEVFDIEYWPVEAAKLTRIRPPSTGNARVAVVLGAHTAFGKATVQHLTAGGVEVWPIATVPQRTSEPASPSTLPSSSAAKPATAAHCDLGDPGRIRAALDRIILAQGGFDGLVLVLDEGEAPLAERLREGVAAVSNLLGEAASTLQEQGLPASVILVWSVAGASAAGQHGEGAVADATLRQLVTTLAGALPSPLRVHGLAVHAPDAGAALARTVEDLIGDTTRWQPGSTLEIGAGQPAAGSLK